MADISGIVTLGAAEVPGAATVLLLNEAGDTIVASTVSDVSTGAYSFSGLPAAVNYYLAVMGNGTFRSRVYGPCTTNVRYLLTEEGDFIVTEELDRIILED